MYVPHPGDLRHKIAIGVTTNVVNENGYPVAVSYTHLTLPTIYSV